MVRTFRVSGECLTSENLIKALMTHFGDLINIYISEEDEGSTSKESTIFSTADDLQSLHEALSAKDLQLKKTELNYSKAIVTLESIERESNELISQFQILRKKYDQQKLVLTQSLWKHCCQHHPELRQIPPIESTGFIETDSIVGGYSIGGFLGEGQFATVKAAYRNVQNVPTEFALKIVRKDRVNTFSSLKRLSKEIEIMRKLKCEYIVSLEEVIHTQNMLYIVMEKGSLDLFAFFDEYPDGVKEDWAKKITFYMVRGILYLHSKSYCHRDLKPEVRFSYFITLRNNKYISVLFLYVFFYRTFYSTSTLGKEPV